MRSRYDLMLESSVYDEDLQKYPDPLSVNFSAFKFTQPPIVYEVTETFVQKPYLITAALYKNPELEDIILNINNIPNISVLANNIESSPTISLPVLEDLFNFLKYPNRGI